MAHAASQEERIQKQAWLSAIQSGTFSIPSILLQHYKQGGLNDSQAMLILQLLNFQQAERNDFPTPQQIASRMALTEQQVVERLTQLLSKGWITIEEVKSNENTRQSERYQLTQVWDKIADIAMRAVRKEVQPQLLPTADVIKPKQTQEELSNARLYRSFEQEFGRPLSPLELDMINGWLDEDRHPPELVLEALKESVFSEKKHFRYIDRVLLEWNKQKIKTVAEAKSFAAQFRGRR